MPLIKGKSNKAFEHNLKTEMKHGKPQDQALAIAYSVKRKAKKKYAKGGEVNESAVSERRPMPEERDKDTKMVEHNSSKKQLVEGDWTDKPTVKQAQANSSRRVMPIKHPKMVPSSVFSARLRDEEDDLMESSKPGPYGEQPAKHLDEEEADKSGPDVSALHMKKMAHGGKISNSDEDENMHIDENPMHDEYQYGAKAEEDRAEHPAGLEEDDDQMRPPMSDYMEEHDAAQYAEGGEIDDMDQPEDEEELEHKSSIAAAIMAKRKYAKGGEIHSHDSIYSDDSDMADLSRNADEDANEEDQLSFNALRKENYSESDALDDLDQPTDSNEHGDDRETSSENEHDNEIVSAIRRKMKKKSAITK